MQLVARPNYAQNEIKYGDFGCIFSNNALSTVKSVIHFVQQVARYDPRSTHTRNVIYLFRIFTISCNKLHTTIHDQPTHGTLFNAFEYSQFRASRCTLRFTISCNKLHATKTKKCGEKQRIFSPHFNWIQR